MKVFKFEERIPATIVQYYEVVAETEEEALEMVKAGKGFQDSFTDGAYGAPGEFELYDMEDVDPE